MLKYLKIFRALITILPQIEMATYDGIITLKEAISIAESIFEQFDIKIMDKELFNLDEE